MISLSQAAPPAAIPVTDIDVSVVLPVFNEATYLAKCLESLLRQTGCRFEVLVVDDGSKDATPAILSGFAARDSRVRIFRQERRGPGAARNLAASEARGAILAFCDGDMEFDPTYLVRLIAPILRGDAVGTFSKEEYVANYHKVWARCWNINDGMASNRRHPDDWPDRHEVFRAVRRDAFVRVQGFKPLGSGDDGTLAPKLGELALAAPGAVCYHYNPESLGEAFRSARWYARGRRIPATWRNVLTHTPPVSLKRSVRRAFRYRLPQFVLLKLVVDAGILTGLCEKQLKRLRRVGQHG